MPSNLNKNTIGKFLNEANKNSYANKNAPKTASLRPASKDYHFEKDNLIYHDTYFGERNFIGEEVIYENNIPVWGANYYGFIIGEKTNEKDVYVFLRQALIQDCGDMIPIRGPAAFKGEWSEYRFNVSGDLENFVGTEEIYFDEKIVYRCFIRGGVIE
jgi:hypothetical protein